MTRIRDKHAEAYPSGNCETSEFRPILDAKVQPLDEGL